MLPFTTVQFVAVLVEYNLAVWPMQMLACLLGAGMVILLLGRWPGSDRFIGGGLAAMWAWTGIAYHGLYFSSINRAALAFATLFLLQGGLLFWAAFRGHLRFGPSAGPAGWLGWAFLAYAMVLYPLVGIAAGHGYPAMPMFGITPCPVTIFTFGLLLLTTAPVPRRLLVIPFIWSLIGGSAAFLLDVPEDWLLLFSGIAIPSLMLRDRARPGAVATARMEKSPVAKRTA